jgi:hypothetical protein
MAVTEDQRALLGLLLTGETYESVAGVLGTTPGDVRSRTHDAVEALEREPNEDISAEEVRERIEVLEGVRPAPSAPPAEARDIRRYGLWAAVIFAAATLVIVLFAVRSGGGNDSQTITGANSPQEDVVPIRLTPVGGAQASGTIAVVRAGDQPAVDLAIRGLRPAGKGQTYVLWFSGAGGRALPVAFQAVGPNGQLTGRTQIPTAAVGLLPSFTTAELTLTRQVAAADAVRRAAQASTLPQPVGTPILRGALR